MRAVVAVKLLAAAVAASIRPARRVARIDSERVLRDEQSGREPSAF